MARKSLPEDLISGPDQSPQNRWAVEPSQREVLVVVAVTAFFFVATVSLFRPFFFVARNTGDAGAYIQIASAIRHWNFQGLIVKAFWGLPYAMACVAMATRISEFGAYLVISYVAGLSAIVLVWRLWGGWVAGLFCVVSFDWMERLYLGGGEPLFTALLFGSFLAIRRRRWVLAALLASLSTIVRPLGLFALVYGILMVAFLFYLARLIAHGPHDIEQPYPQIAAH